MSYTLFAIYEQRRYRPGGDAGGCLDFAEVAPSGSSFVIATAVSETDPTGETFHICREIV